MYEPYRASLMAIWSEMSRASQKYPALFHQRLSDPMIVGPDVISEEGFAAFQKKFHDDDWASWERTPDGSYWGRFHGSGEGLDEFTRLAESAYLVLKEFDTELHDGHGFHGWLNVIHDMARDFPTPLLRTRYGVWGVDPQPTGEKFDELVNAWEDSAATRFRPHPFFNLLVHNVFTSSMSAIELILNPEKALLIGEWLDDFSVALYGSDNESGQEQASEGMISQPIQAFAIQEATNQNLPTPSFEPAVAQPIVEINFDGTTWSFRYDFAGIKEKGEITTNLNGFKLYRTILEGDGAEPLSSLQFWNASGLRTPSISYAANGTVDADAETRLGMIQADGDEKSVSLRVASRVEMIDSKGRQKIDEVLRGLESELLHCLNLERREEIEQQIRSIELSRSKYLNIRGESRTLFGSEEEKARKRITNALSAARDALSKRKLSKLTQYLLMTVTNNGGWSYRSSRSMVLLKQS